MSSLDTETPPLSIRILRVEGGEGLPVPTPATPLSAGCDLTAAVLETTTLEPGDRALIQGDWKAVSAKRSKWELYNLTEDRTELNDLAEQDPKRLRKMINEWFRVAKDVDRLKPGQLKPASGKPSELKFKRMKN